MLTLDQVRDLETKVLEIIERVRDLGSENQKLQERLSEKEARFAELESQLLKEEKDRQEIEQGVLTALNLLGEVEPQEQKKSPSLDTEQKSPSPPSPPQEKTIGGSAKTAKDDQDMIIF